MERCLQEFRVRGVKTNIPFLLNLVTHPTFLAGDVHDAVPRRDARAVPASRSARTARRKLLTYIAEVIVNGHPEVNAARLPAGRGVAGRAGRIRRSALPADVAEGHARPASRNSGPEKFAAVGARAEAAARHRHDLPRRPPVAAGHADAHLRHARASPTATPRAHADLFSLEMWGGATFDTSMRFLKESPWDRLARAPRARSRTSSSRCCCGRERRRLHELPRQRRHGVRQGVGRSAGIDLFRIFDALQLAAEPEARRSRPSARPDAICEAAICYTGDILDPKRDKYTLELLRRPGEGAGEARRAHPRHQGHGRPVQAVRRREAGQGAARGGRHADPLPHARLGRRAGRVVPAGRGGGRRHRRRRVRLDVRADHPAEPERARRGAAVHRPRHRPRLRRPAARRPTTGRTSASYYAAVRDRPDCASRPRSTATRCPAGSTRTCISRRKSLGLGDRWPEVCRMYAEVNQLFGDIVKVTPTSKVVGDMALFMVANNLTPERRARPEARAGVPRIGGRVLRGQARPAAGRVPGGAAEARPARPQADRPTGPARRCRRPTSTPRAQKLEQKLGRTADRPATCCRYLLYPQVFADFAAHQAKYSDTSACCRRRSSSTAWSRARKSASRSSRARR